MVADVFFYALKSVLYPLQPLYDRCESVRCKSVRATGMLFMFKSHVSGGYNSGCEPPKPAVGASEVGWKGQWTSSGDPRDTG